MKTLFIASAMVLALAACKDDSIVTNTTTADACATSVLGEQTTFYGLDQFEGKDKLAFVDCVRKAVAGTATSAVSGGTSIVISTNGL